MTRVHHAHQARLPSVHSEEIVTVLREVLSNQTTLGGLHEISIFATEMWHETNAQKDGTDST